MKNKIPFLVLLVVLLFPCSAFANDIAISENDLVDVSANEFFVEEFDSNQLLLTAPLVAENESIDYSEYLEPISNYYSYNYDDSPILDFSYSPSNFAFHLSENGIYYYHFYDINNYYPYDFNYFGDNEYIEVSQPYIYVYYSSLGIQYFAKCSISNVVELSNEDAALLIVGDIDVYRIDSSFHFDYAITKDDILPLADDIHSIYFDIYVLKYFLLFLVLERVLYIGWDLINFGGKKHE